MRCWFKRVQIWNDPKSLIWVSRRGVELMPRRPNGTVRYADTHYRDTWVAMEKLVDQGLLKAIGLSNFNAKQIDDIFSIAKHKPVVNQV